MGMTYKRVTSKKCRSCEENLPLNRFRTAYSKLCDQCIEHRKIEKRCGQCKHLLPVQEFAKSGEGHQGYCRYCQSQNGPKYAASRDKEKLKTKSKREWEHRKNDPTYKEKQKKWREENRKAIAAKQKQWYQTNKKYRHSYTNNSRAKSLGVPGYIKFEDWKFVLDLAGNICLACNCWEDELVLDHVVPLEKGGLNVIENVQPLCARCNLKKGTKLDLDFRHRIITEAIKKNCTLGLMAKE